MADMINHPPHYQPNFESWPVECIQITIWLPFAIGNAIKYIWRAGSKGGRQQAVDDLNKARWYIKVWHELQDEEPAATAALMAGRITARIVFSTLKKPTTRTVERARYNAIAGLLNDDTTVDESNEDIDALQRAIEEEDEHEGRD